MSGNALIGTCPDDGGAWVAVLVLDDDASGDSGCQFSGCSVLWNNCLRRIVTSARNSAQSIE